MIDFHASLHCLFLWRGHSQPVSPTRLDVELKTKLDLSKIDHEKVKALVKMEVLMLDEVSMSHREKTADAPLRTPTS